jgi:hypothetical protein
VNQPRFDVICTTIGNGSFIRRYTEVIQNAGLVDQVRLVVIPDRKTPAGLYQAAEGARGHGISVICPDIDSQRHFVEKIGAGDFFPWDSDNRRNIGYLIAWRDGADVAISVDDDNLPSEEFFAEHAVVAAPPTVRHIVHAESGWFNICDLLTVEPIPVWPRGFPYRHRMPTRVTRQTEPADVAINAGLWLGEPDVDAITRLAVRPTVTAAPGESVVLGEGTWSPVNSQNTALRRSAIPAYYFARMGHQLNGRPVDRYGDIYSGYFAQACAKHLGQRVRAGTPVADHQRNDHDVLQDLRLEFANIDILDDLLAWLTELKLEGTTYRDAYRCLSDALHDAAEELAGPGWNDPVRGMMHRMAHHMRCWLRLCDRIDGTT